MNRSLLIIILFVCSLQGYTQIDTRPVVGVAKFSCDEDATYAGLVTEKVVEMLTNTKRFQVVDRTSHDKIKAELELQKSEAFMDSKNLVEQDIAVAAQKMITGHIAKIPVYAIRNTNETVKGYKASVAFQMKVVDVATGLSTEATSFQGKASNLMLSPQSAVTEAMMSLSNELYEYFRVNFPVMGTIAKILSNKKGGAETVLLNVGKQQGIKLGNRFNVEYIEIFEGQPLPTSIGEIEVTKLVGETFAECKVQTKSGIEIFSRFNSTAPMQCTLIIK